MARIARIVAPGVPHHITQRGNRRQQVFFSEADYLYYYNLLLEWTQKSSLTIWAYCFMPNHIHLIAVPSDETSFRGLGEAHRRYTRYVNFRESWRGHLWQERFSSFPMSERHMYAAMRYVDLNPVRAGLVKNAEEWQWSSARAHILNTQDSLITNTFFLGIDWNSYLVETDAELFRKHENTGRPLGDDAFIKELGDKLKRSFEKKKPGPKK